MDLSRCSRAEEAFEEQDSRQNDLTDDEAHTRCCEAEGNDDGNTHWPSAVVGTSACYLHWIGAGPIGGEHTVVRRVA